MTTLPQTTPIRLPRAGTSSTQLAVPSSMVPVAGGPPAGFSMTGGDLWRVICANAWLIALFVLLSAVAGYFANDYLEKHHSTYTATGTIRMLQPESLDPLHPSAGTDFVAMEMEKQNESVEFRRETLIDDLMKDLDNPIRQTSWWMVTCERDPEKARELLSENLAIDPLPGSSLMKISFTAPFKQDTPVIVTAVINRAIADKRDQLRNKYEADHKRFADLEDRYTVELRNCKTDITNRIEELTELGGNPSGVAGSKDMELGAG